MWTAGASFDVPQRVLAGPGGSGVWLPHAYLGRKVNCCIAPGLWRGSLGAERGKGFVSDSTGSVESD